jgi:putative ATP-dependent endonuclease of OLD family
VSQLTREHLRKTIAFFLSMCEGEAPVPFQEPGTGTLNTLVLALLTFIADIKKDNVIFAMEEPEIALPPHTQRRIANYLLTQTTQCFITSHSPYIIERFEPESIIRLTRDAEGILTPVSVVLPACMKAKTYRSQLRRMIAEAMLGQGVIVGEGITEQLAITTVAKKMEEYDPELFPLDLAGVSVINTEGDGNLEPIGSFFKALGIRAFAFFDKKDRTPRRDRENQREFHCGSRNPIQGSRNSVSCGNTSRSAVAVPASCPCRRPGRRFWHPSHATRCRRTQGTCDRDP